MRTTCVAVLVSTVFVPVPVVGQEWSGRARVDGRVTDTVGAPLAGAAVSARHLVLQGGPQVTSDAEGRFALDGIASGSWMVEVAAAGHASRQIGVHLPTESSWLDILEVQLEEPQPEPRPSRSGTFLAAGGRGSPVSHEDVRAVLAEGRVDRARGLLSLVDPDDPGEAGLFFEIGQGLLAAGATEEAITLFGRALDRDPGHVGAHYGRALGQLALGHSEDARRDLEAVLVLRPGSALAEKAGLALEQLAPAPLRETP